MYALDLHMARIQTAVRDVHYARGHVQPQPALACAVCSHPPLRLPVNIEKAAEKVMLGALHIYRTQISPGQPKRCRFVPSCSVYMIQAIERYGALKGLVLSTWRLARCNPFGGRGVDEPSWPPVGFRAGNWDDL